MDLGSVKRHHYRPVPLMVPPAEEVPPTLPAGRKKRFSSRVRTGCTVCRPTFLCLIVCDAIAAASRSRGRLIRRGEDPACAGLWRSHARYLLEHIELLNRYMSRDMRHATFQSFQATIDFDFIVDGFMWQAHMNGCFAYVEHVGGIAAVLDKPGSFELCGLLYRVMRSNTTTPARRQVAGYYDYTDEQFRRLLGTTLDPTTPCPAELVLRLIEITRLRFEIGAGLTLEAQVVHRAPTLFGEIEDFDVAAWAEGPTAAVVIARIQYGEIFQLAIKLYGMLALPRSAVLAAYPDDGEEEEEEERSRTLTRRKLVQLLGLMYPTIKHIGSLQWPFVVAGVAAAGTGVDAVEDQKFIDKCMYAIWRQPLSDCSTFHCLRKLRAFWQLGQTEWEECFYEPTPC
ncbi:hypothetical protein PWT90_11180 [Aphanocladium album]|nr:hypothetical protein PWT90_11180 [Aphanocladium album]